MPTPSVPFFPHTQAPVSRESISLSEVEAQMQEGSDFRGLILETETGFLMTGWLEGVCISLVMLADHPLLICFVILLSVEEKTKCW